MHYEKEIMQATIRARMSRWLAVVFIVLAVGFGPVAVIQGNSILFAAVAVYAFAAWSHIVSAKRFAATAENYRDLSRCFTS